MKHELKLLLAFLISLVHSLTLTTPPATHVTLLTVTSPSTYLSYSTVRQANTSTTWKWHPTPLNTSRVAFPTGWFANATRGANESVVTVTVPTRNLALLGAEGSKTSTTTATGVVASSPVVAVVSAAGVVGVQGWIVVVWVLGVALLAS